jgi:hypothetical protein
LGIAPDLTSAGPRFVLANLAGSEFTAGSFLVSISAGIPYAATIFFVLAMFRSLLRKPWLGTSGFLLFASAVTLLANWGGQPGWITVVLSATIAAVVTCVSLRFGLLVAVVMDCTRRFVEHSILTTDVDAWYGQSSLIAVLLVTALTIWAFRVSLGSRPLLSPRAVKA